MLDLVIKSDVNHDNTGYIIIHAAGTLPEICAELEIFAAETVRGLAKQMPPGSEEYARVRFSIAMVNGARAGLKED